MKKNTNGSAGKHGGKKKFLLLLLIIPIAVIAAVFFISKEYDAGEYKPAAAYSGILRACDKDIVDVSGNKILLRGTNLGGWLIMEEWQCPMNATDAMLMYDTLTERFGYDRAMELLKIYEDNFIVESDFDNIKALGLNCVRLPFWYRNFTDENGEWKLNEQGEIDFSRLDWVVEQCRKRGMYVILDLHGAPGFQSDAAHSGKYKDSDLFDDTAEGEAFRDKTVELWQAIAEHFRDNETVACYDLLNEPGCDMNVTAMQGDIAKLYDRLIKAIREIDPQHMISVECIWRMNAMPSPQKYGWTNVLYQMHTYDYSEFTISGIIASVKAHFYYNVPVYIGELNADGLIGYMLNEYNNNNISWTTWTYKGVQSGFSTWFLYGLEGENIKADIFNDSYDTIAKKWGAAIRTENAKPNEFMLSVVSDAANGVDFEKSNEKNMKIYDKYQ